MPAFRLPTLVAVLLAFPIAAVAQDAEVKKQKETAAENLKQAGVTKPELAETKNLLVYSTLTAEKTKPIADAAQKAFDAAKKALKYDDKDRMWAGKLTVYMLADRKEFMSFVRLVESRKPEADDVWSVNVRGTEPYVAAGVLATAKTPEVSLREETAGAVAAALLDQKAGASSTTFTLPSWLHVGFGKAVAYRLDPKAMEAYRGRTKALFGKGKVGTFQAADLWAESTPKDFETLSVSLAEYMVYGPDSGKFAKFLGGYKPNETVMMPNSGNALEAANWKPETLDVAWKTWAVKQK